MICGVENRVELHAIGAVAGLLSDRDGDIRLAGDLAPFRQPPVADQARVQRVDDRDRIIGRHELIAVGINERLGWIMLRRQGPGIKRIDVIDNRQRVAGSNGAVPIDVERIHGVPPIDVEHPSVFELLEPSATGFDSLSLTVR